MTAGAISSTEQLLGWSQELWHPAQVHLRLQRSLHCSAVQVLKRGVGMPKLSPFLTGLTLANRCKF